MTILDVLENGNVIAVPTDTVYGLAAHFDAAEKLFALKGRRPDHPIPILAASLDQLLPFLDHPPLSLFQLAHHCWPGALTMVVTARNLPKSLIAEGNTGGFRIPNHPLLLDLLEKAGPLAVTSANLTGEPPATTAEEVATIFPHLPILDGGRCDGTPSTVIAYRDNRWYLLREGGVECEMLKILLQNSKDGAKLFS